MIDGISKLDTKKRDKIAERYGWRCWICGGIENLEVHHKVPWKYCKDNSDDNLILLCRTCHRILHRHNNAPGSGDLALLEARGINGPHSLFEECQTQQSISIEKARGQPPIIGEIRYGRDIGKQHGTKYIWQACCFCLRTRWVRLLTYPYDRPEHERCSKCGWHSPDNHNMATQRRLKARQN